MRKKNYDIKENHDFVWVKYCIYLFIRLYESKNLKKKQTEVWYNANVWSIIDNSFDNIDHIKIVRSVSFLLKKTSYDNFIIEESLHLLLVILEKIRID